MVNSFADASAVGFDLVLAPVFRNRAIDAFSIEFKTSGTGDLMTFFREFNEMDFPIITCFITGDGSLQIAITTLPFEVEPVFHTIPGPWNDDTYHLLGVSIQECGQVFRLAASVYMDGEPVAAYSLGGGSFQRSLTKIRFGGGDRTRYSGSLDNFR